MDVERLVRTQISSSELDPAKELVDSINNGSTQLVEVVKALGEYLTSPEGDVRVKGLTYLSNLIKVVSRSRINRPAAKTLKNFYLASLDDFDALLPALEALQVLSKLTSFDGDDAVEVYRQIVENVNMKAYTQSTRHQVYLLFDTLLANHRQAFKDMGPEFISSYTKMVDGEKDPRNLMLLFQLDRVILQEFDVKAQIEDMFDITFCYFPITFRPPPNDPYGITADDLKLALRSCLSASPYFAKMAIPLFLDKYVTAAGPVLRDLLLTMAACFPAYGAEAVAERGMELWEPIKTEILYSSDPTIEAAGLTALESLVRTLYPTASHTPSGLAQDTIKECLEGVCEPEKNQAAGSAKCLAAMVRGSPTAGAFALSQALPQLFKLFNNPKLPSHRTPLLGFITTILLSARSVYASPESNRRHEQERSLEPYREGLFDVLREGLRTDGLKTAAVRGSVALAEIPGFWDRNEVEEVVRAMDDLLINDPDDEVHSEVLSGLKSIAGVFPAVVESVTLPLLVHTLPDQAPAADDATGREKYRSVLASLTELCVLPALFETLVVRVITKLDLLSSGEADSAAASQRECNVAYAWDLLHTVQKVIDTKLEAKHVDVAKYYAQIVPRLFGFVVSASLSTKSDGLFRDRRLTTSVATIAETLFWEQTSEKQATIFESAYNAFEKGDLSRIVYDAGVLGGVEPGSPLRPNAPSSEQNLVALYSAIVRGLKADTALPFTSASEFLQSKVHWAVNVARDNFQLRVMLDLITAFVNKRAGEIGDGLQILDALWVKDVQETTQPAEVRHRALLVYLHIVKGLALIRNEIAYTAIQRVIDILGLSSLDPAFVDEAARGFVVLAEGGGKGKGRGAHLTTRLLYAQKLWSYILPKLIAGDKEADVKSRLPYLVAFASLLPLAPASICLSDLPTILPLLLRSLALPNPEQRTNVIVTLTSILETANSSTATDQLLHEHAETMVDGLLRSALPQAGQPSSGRVRAAALTALAVFPDAIRYETLHTAKARVIRDLGLAVDDPLRAVRREAVDTRAKWYTFGSA